MIWVIKKHHVGLLLVIIVALKYQVFGKKVEQSKHGTGGLPMAAIKTKLNIGDTVWWVHCSNKIYKGTVEEISCCDYQGALYCQIYSPSFRRNPYPTVHYSNIFKSKDDAQKFAEYQKANPDDVFPKCMGCHYNAFKEGLNG